MQYLGNNSINMFCLAEPDPLYLNNLKNHKMPSELFEEEGLERIPDLRLSQWLFLATLDRSSVKSKTALIEVMVNVIKSESG